MDLDQLDPLGRITHVCVPRKGVLDPTLAMIAAGSGVVALGMHQEPKLSLPPENVSLAE